MDTTQLVAFWGLSILLVITPGVDWAHAIGAGVGHGRVVPAVGGMIAGQFVATCIAAAGVAVVVASSATAMSVLTAAGAAYLVWLGTSAISSARSATTTSVGASRERPFLAGMGVSLLNPKVLLLFVALLPQFTSESATWPFAAQVLCLGCVHLLNCGVVYLAVGWASGALLSARPRAAQVVTLVSGVAMVLLGVGLVAEMVVPAVA